MKKLSYTLCLLLPALQLLAQGEKNFIDQPYIIAEGYADTLVAPNQIFLDIQLSEQDVKDRKPIEELEKNLLSGLKSLGIATDKYLTVKNFNSQYQWVNMTTKIIKSKTFQLEVHDDLTVAQVFQKLESIRVGNVRIASVHHTEYKKIAQQCKVKAIAHAQELAMAQLKPLKQELGKALFIGSTNTPLAATTPEQVNAVYASKKSYTGNTATVIEEIKLNKILFKEEVHIYFSIK